MPNRNLPEAWSKILLGLKAAGVPESQQKTLREILFLSISEPEAMKIVNGLGGFGLFAANSDEGKTRRNLARAMNALLGVKAFGLGLPYAADKAWRDRINNKAFSLDAAKAAVRRESDALLKVDDLPQPMPAQRPPERPGITPGAAIILPTPAPASHRYDPAIRNKWQTAVRRMTTLKQATRLISQEGAARQARLHDYVSHGMGDIGQVWQMAYQAVRNTIANDEKWFLYNYTSFNSAITSAYEKFNANVKDGGDAIGARVALVKQLFGALKYAPPPICLLGTLGERALGELTVDMAIDPRGRFQTVAADKSGFMDKLAEKLDQYHDFMRVGPDLASLPTVSAIHTALDQVSAVQLRVMQEQLQVVCDEHFGDTTTVLDKIRSFKVAAVKVAYPNLRGRIGERSEADAVGRRNIELAVVQEITRYKDELIGQLRATLKVSPVHVPFDDMSTAVLMQLNAHYVIKLFARDADFHLKPLAEAIVDFFAQAGPWGILHKGGSHPDASAQRRLSWKGGPNHKRALLMFCQWHMKNINPFLMVAGASRKGMPYNPKLIQALCVVEIDRINRAITAGRSKGRLGANWDWAKINAAYAAG